jgi:hypothetical protein
VADTVVATISPVTFRDARDAGPVTKRLPVVDIELVVINELTVSVLRDNVDNVPVALEVRTNNVE